MHDDGSGPREEGTHATQAAIEKLRLQIAHAQEHLSSLESVVNQVPYKIDNGNRHASPSSTLQSVGVSDSEATECVDNAIRHIITALRQLNNAPFHRLKIQSAADAFVKRRYEADASNMRRMPSNIDDAGTIPVGRSVIHQTKGPGRVVYRGPTVLGAGTWYGIVFDSDCGTCDGSVELPLRQAPVGGRRSYRYFECAANHGIFCRQGAIDVAGVANHVRSLHRFEPKVVTAICVASPEVQTPPQIRFAVTPRSTVLSLYVTLYQQFSQLHGYVARFYGIDGVQDGAISSVKAADHEANVLQILSSKFKQPPPLHKLGQLFTSDSGLAPLLLSIEPSNNRHMTNFWMSRSAELAATFRVACEDQYRDDCLSNLHGSHAKGLQFQCFEQFLYYAIRVGVSKPTTVAEFQFGEPQTHETEEDAIVSTTIDRVARPLFEAFTTGSDFYDGPSTDGITLDDMKHILDIVQCTLPSTILSRGTKAKLQADSKPIKPYGNGGGINQISFTKNIRAKRKQCWALVGMTFLLIVRTIWVLAFGTGHDEWANGYVAASTQGFAFSFAVDASQTGDYLLDYAMLESWVDSSFVVSSGSTEEYALPTTIPSPAPTASNTSTSTSTTTTIPTVSSSIAVTSRTPPTPQRNGSATTGAAFTTAGILTISGGSSGLPNTATTTTAASGSTTTTTTTLLGGSEGVNATIQVTAGVAAPVSATTPPVATTTGTSATPAAISRKLWSEVTCEFGACTRNSIEDATLGRGVPSEVTSLYSSGILPIVNGRNLLCGPVMLYQWRVQSEVLEINKDDFGGQSLSVERSPYFSAAAADTTSTVPNATNVEQVGTTVRNIIFPGYASSYPLQSAYVTSFDGANATALRQELASVIGAQGYISENATAALMIRSMLFNADDGSYYSCGFMFEDSRCGSLIPSARCSVANSGDYFSLSFWGILTTLHFCVLIVELYGMATVARDNGRKTLSELPESTSLSAKLYRSFHSLRSLLSWKFFMAIVMCVFLMWEYVILGQMMVNLDEVALGQDGLTTFLSQSVANVAEFEHLFSLSTTLRWLHLGQTAYQLLFVIEKAANIPLSRHCFLYYRSCCHVSMLALLLVILVLVVIIVFWMAAVVTTEDHRSPFLTFNFLFVSLSTFGLAPVRGEEMYSVVQGYATFFSLLISAVAMIVPPFFYSVVAERFQEERCNVPPQVSWWVLLSPTGHPKTVPVDSGKAQRHQTSEESTVLSEDESDQEHHHTSDEIDSETNSVDASSTVNELRRDRSDRTDTETTQEHVEKQSPDNTPVSDDESQQSHSSADRRGAATDEDCSHDHNDGDESVVSSQE